MHNLYGLFLLFGSIPILRAVVANRGTSLRYSTLWAVAAWLGWVLTAPSFFGQWHPGHYLVLSLTACVGVSVLGARHPGAKAWNFVVLCLLVILSWPLAVGLGELRIDLAHVIFLWRTTARIRGELPANSPWCGCSYYGYYLRV